MTSGAGKSGSLFLRSADNAYLLKTLIKEEKNTLLRIIPALVQHLEERGESLLSRPFLLCRFSQGPRKFYFTILSNVLPPQGPSGVGPGEVFDLKGSRVNRTNPASALTKASTVRMDGDLAGRRFATDRATVDRLRRILDADASFLASQNLMDYSLLVGVFSPGIAPSARPGPVPPLALPSTSDPSESGQAHSESYLVGIIDYLQDYNAKKKAANAVKKIFFPEDQLSTVEPMFYAFRFLSFLAETIVPEEENSKVKAKPKPNRSADPPKAQSTPNGLAKEATTNGKGNQTEEKKGRR